MLETKILQAKGIEFWGAGVYDFKSGGSGKALLGWGHLSRDLRDRGNKSWGYLVEKQSS